MTANTTLKSWTARLASLLVLLLVGYAGYRIFICHPITNDVAKAWDTSCFYITKGTLVSAAVFSLILAAACAICRQFLRKDFLIFSVPIVMILCAGHAGALAGFLIQAAAALAIGLPIYRRMRSSQLPTHSSLAGLILSWFLGGSVNAYLAWIALHWKINYSCIYFAVAMAEMVLFRQTLAETLLAAVKRLQSYRFTPGQWAIVFWAVFVLPYSLIPLYGFDDCLRHIFFPKQVALFGRNFFDPSNIWSLDTEMFSQSCYTISYLLGGEFALRLSSLAAPIAAMLLLEDCCRRLFGPGTAFCTALALVSTPLLGVTVLAVSLETLNFLSVAALVVVALYALQNLDRNAIILVLAIAAFAFLYKQQAVFLAIPVSAILLLASSARSIKKRSIGPMISLASGVMLAIIIVAPFLTQNYVLTKNPFFPWFNGVFRSQFLAPANILGYRFAQPLPLATLVDLTFSGRLFVENGSFIFSVNCFVVAWFIPFVFLDRKNTALKWTLFCLFAASFLLWWKITSPNLRYFVGPLVPGAILIGLTVNLLWESLRRDRFARTLGVLSLAAAICIDAMSLLNTAEPICFYPLVQAFTRQYASLGPYMSNLGEIQKVFSISYAKFGKDASCLLASSPYLCVADHHVEALNHTYYANWEAMNKWQNEQDAFDWIFAKRRFTCLIISQDCTIPPLMSPRFREMLNVEFSRAGFSLLTPKQRPPITPTAN